MDDYNQSLRQTGVPALRLYLTSRKSCGSDAKPFGTDTPAIFGKNVGVDRFTVGPGPSR
jgi:hypothetical protein